MSQSNENFEKTYRSKTHREEQAYATVQEARKRKGKRQQDTRKLAQREAQEGR